MVVRIGTRGSALALAQSGWVRDRLRYGHPDIEVELRVIKTSGDRFIDTPLANIGGKGVFTKEIEDALLGTEIAPEDPASILYTSRGAFDEGSAHRVAVRARHSGGASA